jgi:ribosomal protein L29
MSVKIHKIADLKKMSEEDRKELLAKTLASLAHQRLRVRTNEDKKSDLISKMKVQVARINTLNSGNRLKT